jgi:hypothetical protein
MMDSDSGDSDSGEAANSDVEQEGPAEGGPQQGDKTVNSRDAPVWLHGGIKLPDGTQNCTLCSYSIKPSKSNSGNMTNHVLKKHNRTETANNLKIAIGNKAKLQGEKRKMKENKKSDVAGMLKFVKMQPKITDSYREEMVGAVLQHLVTSNNPFSEVDEWSFRNMMFIANPGLVLPSRHTIARRVDTEFLKIEAALKKEIATKVNKTSHKTIHITYDHGTSGDRFRTKKLGVSVHYMDVELKMTTETLGAIECIGSQTGPVVREKVKDLLVRRAGWEVGWRVCPTTDGASNVVSSRSIGRHPAVGLTITFETSCVDHKLHLVIEDALAMENTVDIQEAIARVRAFVEYFKQSSIALQAFLQIQESLGMVVISPVQGTSNR